MPLMSKCGIRLRNKLSTPCCHTWHRTLPQISPGDIHGILGIYHKYTTNIPRPPLSTFVVYPRYSHKIPRISPRDIQSWAYSRYISGLFMVYFGYIQAHYHEPIA